MSNPSKKRGSKWERELTAWLVGRGLDARRQHLAGREDVGDIHIISSGGEIDWVLEAKTRGDRRLVPESADLAKWCAEAARECEHAGGRAWAVVVRRHGSSDPGDAWVWTPLSNLSAAYDAEWFAGEVCGLSLRAWAA